MGTCDSWRSGTHPLALYVLMYYDEYMKQTQFQLFLGRNIPDAGKITDEMMSDFIKSEVSTRFDGFTVTDGTGFWKGEQEKVAIITFVTADGSTKVQEIADSFKESFRQDSVLMTETQLPVCQFI